MPATIGATDIVKVYAGTVEIEYAYAGAVEAYSAEQPQLELDQKNAIDDIVEANMLLAPTSPGCIIDITGPEGAYTKAYGYNLDPSIITPLTTTASFRIGSVTKLFTAMAFWLAVDAEDIDVTDVLEDYVPGFEYGDDITMLHLLSHKSGVYDYTYEVETLTKILNTPTTPFSQEQAIEISMAQAAVAEPGDEYAYSNINAMLLSACVEAATGRLISEIINEDIVQPLGLSKTYWPTDTNVPWPNMDNKGSMNPEFLGAAGGMVSTVKDLTKFLQAIMDGKLLSEDSSETWLDTFGTTLDNTMGETPPDDIFSGYFMLGFGTWQGHEGNVLNAGTAAVFDPDDGATIVVAQNVPGWMTGGVAFYRMMRDIAEYLYPDSI